jgi:hypothetical protein
MNVSCLPAKKTNAEGRSEKREYFFALGSTLPNENIPLIMRIAVVFFSFLPPSVKKPSKIILAHKNRFPYLCAT